MDYKKLEQIIRFVEESGEKFIIMFEGTTEPMVLVPFKAFQGMYAKDGRPAADSLTRSPELDRIEPKQNYAEPREKPQLIKQVIEERGKSMVPQAASARKEGPQAVSEEDRYYFEPVE